MNDLTPDTKRALARDIINSPLFPSLINEMEMSAFNQAVAAAKTDDDARAALLAEVRAIRSFVSKLSSYAGEVTAPKKAPA